LDNDNKENELMIDIETCDITKNDQERIKIIGTKVLCKNVFHYHALMNKINEENRKIYSNQIEIVSDFIKHHVESEENFKISS